MIPAQLVKPPRYDCCRISSPSPLLGLNMFKEVNRNHCVSSWSCLNHINGLHISKYIYMHMYIYIHHYTVPVYYMVAQCDIIIPFVTFPKNVSIQPVVSFVGQPWGTHPDLTHPGDASATSCSLICNTAASTASHQAALPKVSTESWVFPLKSRRKWHSPKALPKPRRMGFITIRFERFDGLLFPPPKKKNMSWTVENSRR